MYMYNVCVSVLLTKRVGVSPERKRIDWVGSVKSTSTVNTDI